MAKKGRKKPKNLVPVANLKEADVALMEIASLNRKVAEIEHRLSEDIDNLKAQAKAEVEPLKQKLKGLETGLEAFAAHNRDQLFKKKKSVELNFGVLGFRLSTKIKTKQTTLEKLIEMDFTDAIKVKRSIDKEAMRDWPDERLATVDAERDRQDVFYYEVKEEELSETG